MISLVFSFILNAALYAQTPGCITLEGLKMPCFNGGVCETQITCYGYSKRSKIAERTCGCTGSGFEPGSCDGQFVGIGECSNEDPCNANSESACMAQTNNCWVCNFQAGESTGPEPRCAITARTECYEAYAPTVICGSVCPEGYTDNPNDPPPGILCEDLPPLTGCKDASECPPCS